MPTATIDGAIGGSVTPALDPKATPVPTNIIDDGKGGVIVDPTKAVTPPAKADERPTWLPEKFKTAEDMAVAYKELETKQGQPAKVEPIPADAAAAAVEKAGLDVTAISKEYTDNGGKLTEATMKTLATKGITPEMVTGYISGLQAQATQTRTEMEAIAGGAEKLQSVYSWAKTNLAPQEIKAYDDLIGAGNFALAKTVLHGIVSRFTTATGTDPKLVTGGVVHAADAPPYESTAQVREAMSDPRYQTDEAYRQKVAKRLGNTSMFGVN